ncbi:MAG TPA: matrixin family metalloprotease [Anaerolineales bacterium]|nr:matrixin family metalloprotease [Anaerolineales bacterium]
MRFKRLIIVSVLVTLLFPISAQAKPSEAPPGIPDCSLPESNAEGLEILSNYYPGYWWDHTNLTVAVQAHPSATQEQRSAINDAIATWDAALRDCFDNLITLTNVTGQKNRRRGVDIVLHYGQNAGGVSFAGYAICGHHKCPNILVTSDAPPSLVTQPYDPEYIYWVTVHELGHALGLGHATNLLESTDIMGYGWPDLGDPEPIISDCNIDALAFVFAWALEGSEPHPPAEGPYDCSLD